MICIKDILRNAGILKEEYTVCNINAGYGIIIRVQNDHKPFHAHVLSVDNKLIGRFIITKNKPDDKDDIVSYRCKLPSNIRKIIVKWSSQDVRGINNWVRLIDGWNGENPENEIR